jgi:hypothetical protein
MLFPNILQPNSVGSNLFIGDNKDPKKGGSLVTCKNNNVFCNGLKNLSINDEPNIVNTDCKTKGVAGKPGVGVCPK